MHIQNIHTIIHQLINQILSKHEILKSMKGHNSVKNIEKIRPKPDLIYINAYTKFYPDPSICLKDIEEK